MDIDRDNFNLRARVFGPPLVNAIDPVENFLGVLHKMVGFSTGEGFSQLDNNPSRKTPEGPIGSTVNRPANNLPRLLMGLDRPLQSGVVQTVSEWLTDFSC